jgi:hypothetical protein
MSDPPRAAEPPRRLRAGMVGGGRGAFIGSVHRMAAELDGQALASHPRIAVRARRAHH